MINEIYEIDRLVSDLRNELNEHDSYIVDSVSYIFDRIEYSLDSLERRVL